MRTATRMVVLNSKKYALDLISAVVAAAYSLRRLYASYTGAAIRVRRSSDGAQADIGFMANGDLDTVALLVFVGLGSGFITIWYDQSGNGCHATQATAANQPRIVTSGTIETRNGKPVVTFSSNTLIIDTGGIPQPYNIFLVGQSNSNSVPFFFDGTTSGNRVAMGHNANNVVADIGRAHMGSGYIGSGSDFFMAPSGSSFAYNAPGILVGEFNGINSKMFANGSTVANGNGGSTAIQSLLLGNRHQTAAGGQTFLNGYIGEFVVIIGPLSTTDRQTLERNEGIYFNISVS